MTSRSSSSTLLRRHIGQRLAAYYAQPSEVVVGSAASPPDFRRLLGEWHWKQVYRRLYRDQQGQWLTPVELFQPYFSNILAEFVAQNTRYRTDGNVEPLEIIELGCGRGTNAQCLLTHLQTAHPAVYDRLSSYTLVDASPTLHELQQQRLLNSSVVDTLHSDKLRFVQQDLSEVADSK